MRIGILTFHNAINYGAILQCYALKEFIALRGHDVEVINYQNPYIAEFVSLFPRFALAQEKGLKNKIKLCIKNILLYNKRRRIGRVFSSFVESRLNLTSKIKSIEDIPSIYDYIIFGSDQIWNPHLCNGFDPVFWGQFPKGKSKFVVYAASLGEVSRLDDNDWNNIGKRLSVFDYISVRELSTQQVLEALFHNSISQCLDPTLLVDPIVLSNIAIIPNEDNYVFLFNVVRDSSAESFAEYLAAQLGCKVIVGQAKPRITSLRNNVNNTLVDSISPEQFLGYIKKARVVIGNSFHSIALSIAFRKSFYSLDSRNPERIISLLSMLGLQNRHIKATDNKNIDFCDIDYDSVNDIIAKMREKSIRYLVNTGI